MEELTQFYARLLRIERPWIVIEVRFPDQERVDVYVDHERGIKLRCPRCDAWCPVYDHSPEREWRHLDTCDVPTYIHTRLPRVQCKVHGVLSIASEWAEPGSNLTRALEAHVIDLAKEASLQAVSRLTGLSWDRCCGVLDRAVRRGQRRKAWKVPVHLGVDEKAFAKRHQYMTLVCDLETKSVEYVAEGRRQESLEEYFLPFDEDELERIEAICVDMHDPYIAAVRARVSRAWALKENLRQLWTYRRQGWARRFFRRWYFWATHSRLPPVIAVARTLKRRLDNILIYLRHRITNALNESVNAQVEKVKRMARGYRNRTHFQTAIYFHCGGLDLYPRPQHVGATHSNSG